MAPKHLFRWHSAYQSGHFLPAPGTDTCDHASTPTSLPHSSWMERRSRARITKQKRKALLAQIVLLLLHTLTTTAHSSSPGAYSKSIHTDLYITWMKASLLRFISTLTRPLLKRETELTESKVRGLMGSGRELGDCWSSLVCAELPTPPRTSGPLWQLLSSRVQGDTTVCISQP